MDYLKWAKRACSLGRVWMLFTIALLASGCATTSSVQPTPTALQIRQYQTREYDLNDMRRVMKAVLNVLQDEGFVTKNAVTDLGLITATKEIDRQNFGMPNWALILGNNEPTWQKTEVIEATANVSEYGSRTKVRLSFQRKILDNRGGVMSVSEIQDSQYYQDFLVRIDHGVYLEREHL